MGLEILTAAVLINLLLLIGLALAVRARPDLLLGRRPGRGPAQEEIGAARREIADLLVELNRVARSHVDAVEERRAALLEAIDAANDRVRRLNALSSDLEVISKRLRLDGARPAEAPASPSVERTARPRDDRLSLGLRDKGSIG